MAEIPWGQNVVPLEQLATTKPIDMAEWEARIVARQPKSLRGSLPTIEVIEAELAPKHGR